MSLEIMCTAIVGYLFLCGTWTMQFFRNIHPEIIYFLENIFPKIIGILIFVYLIGKYIFKLR